MKIRKTDFVDGAVVLEAMNGGSPLITVRHLPDGKVEASWKSLGFVDAERAKEFVETLVEMMKNQR